MKSLLFAVLAVSSVANANPSFSQMEKGQVVTISKDIAVAAGDEQVDLLVGAPFSDDPSCALVIKAATQDRKLIAGTQLIVSGDLESEPIRRTLPPGTICASGCFTEIVTLPLETVKPTGFSDLAIACNARDVDYVTLKASAARAGVIFP